MNFVSLLQTTEDTGNKTTDQASIKRECDVTAVVQEGSSEAVVGETKNNDEEFEVKDEVMEEQEKVEEVVGENVADLS